MSWKSFVTAGLLCALASPAFAQPSVSVVANGTESSSHLNSLGQWVLTIRLAQSNPVVDLPDPDGPGGEDDPVPGSPLAAELGFESSNDLVGAAIATPAVFDDDNPGNVIFGWETLTDLGGDGDCSSTEAGNCPVGLQTDLDEDQVFVAYGSVDLLGDTNPQNFVTITTARPVTTDANVDSVTTITMSGAYGGNGRIAELNPDWDPTDDDPAMSVNYDDYAGDVTRNARAGDTNLDGSVDIADYATLETNYLQAGTKHWYHGDYNGDSTVDIADYALLELNYLETYTVFSDSNINNPSPGPSGGGGSGVPEPASIALLALAALGVSGLRFRR
jgi:hypothetical protein